MKFPTKKLAKSLWITAGMLVIFAALALPLTDLKASEAEDRLPAGDISPHIVTAMPDGIGGLIANAILSITTTILGYLLSLLGQITIFFLNVIQWFVDPTTFHFTTHPTVILGWSYLRDIVNMGLVLGMIVIAISFILRIQTYGSQRTLVRLIAVAILVNFSLVIAGVFLDASSLLTRAIIGERDLSVEITNATGIVSLTGGHAYQKGVLAAPVRTGDVFTATGRLFVDTVFTIFFVMVLTAAMAALVVMLIIRTAWLWFLLIAAPLAWFSWIFPLTENYWREWWQKFLQWTFFVPIVVFFLSIALRLVEPGTIRQLPGGVPVLFVQYMTAVALIILSMIAAQQSGISFANKGVQWATAAARMPDRFLTRQARNLGSTNARSFAQSTAGQNLQKYFAKTRFFGRASDRIEQLRKESDAEIQTQKERIVKAGLSPKEIGQLSKRKFATKEAQVAMTLAAAEHKKFAADPSEGGLSKEEREKHLAIAQSHSRKSAMKVLAADPLLADHYDETYGKIHGKVGGVSGVLRMLSIEDMDTLANNPKALENPEVIQSLLGRPQHLKRLVEKVSTSNLQTLQSGFAKLKQALPNMPEGVQNEFGKLVKNPWMNQHLSLGGPIATHAKAPKIIIPGDREYSDLSNLGNPHEEIKKTAEKTTSSTSSTTRVPGKQNRARDENNEDDDEE